MNTLGLGGSNHDFSSAIVVDGQLKVAIEDERLVRVKRGSRHWASSPCKPSCDYCLETIGCDFTDLDGLYVNVDIESPQPFWEAVTHQKIGHHLNHASAAFYPSPFTDAALLVIDGRGAEIEQNESQGTFETVSVGAGDQLDLDLCPFQVGQQRLATSTWQYITSNSLGWMYRVVTEAIGFDGGCEGKTMAIAAYGEPKFAPLLMRFGSFDGDGRFFFDPYSGVWEELLSAIKNAGNAFQIRADLAASAQQILEEGVVKAATYARRTTGRKHLCYGGGVALNGVANHRLRAESGFDDVFIFPASGDNGLSVGAAFYGYHAILRGARVDRNWSSCASLAYGGRQYSTEDVDIALDRFPVSSKVATKPGDELAERLCSGQYVAVFQGGAEFGPRALGHRSILADPQAPRVRDRMNRLKQRESFRPFAPIILESQADRYFKLAGPSPFMLDIAPPQGAAKSVLEGVLHADGTARVQTVPADGDPLLVDLLSCLIERNRPPVVLNTSFNMSGKPIVETPEDALDAFIKLDLDALYIEGRWVEKHSPWLVRAVEER